MELNGAKILYTIHTDIPILGDFKIVDHSKCNYHFGTGGNSQNKRSCNGIFKKGLKKKTR